MRYVSFDVCELRGLQSFSSVGEMNGVVRVYKGDYRLSGRDRRILDVISRYGCKFVGVCFLSKQKMAEAAGFKSRRTAIRACGRLEELGMIRQYETRRGRGDFGRSVNVIVIQPLADGVVSQGEVTACGHGLDTPIQALGEIHTGTVDTVDVVKLGLRGSMPGMIYDALDPFFDGEGMYEVYGLLLRAKKRGRSLVLLEDYGDEYVNVFYGVIRLYKQGKVRDLMGYLYRAWEGLTDEIIRREKYAELAEIYGV